MSKLVLAAAIFAVLLFAVVGIAAAANPHSGGGTGQPNQSCENPATSTTPGNAASAPGSAFNPNGNAGTHYAGEQPQNSNNPNSVSQYDVACFQNSH
jgi:hypothetical protein